METSGLTRDGTTEPVSRDQILRRERTWSYFPVQLTTSKIGNLTRLIHTQSLAICMCAHTNIPGTYMSCTRLDSHIMHVSFSFSFFFFFFFFSFCLFGDSAFFPDYFCCCTIAAFSLYVVRSFLPNGRFRPCDHGLDF